MHRLFTHIRPDSDDTCSSSVKILDKNGSALPNHRQVSISHLFRPPILILKWIGCCPLLLVTRSGVGNTGQMSNQMELAPPSNDPNSTSQNIVMYYKVRAKSWQTLLTFLIGCGVVTSFLLFMIGYFIRNRQKKAMALKLAASNPNDERLKGEFYLSMLTDESEKFAILLFHLSIAFVIPFTHIIQVMVSWVQAGSLANFLNGFKSLEQNMGQMAAKNLKMGYVDRITKFRNRVLLLYFCMPTALFGLAVFLSGGTKTDARSPFIFFAETLVLILELGVPLLEDTMVVLSYKTLAELFRETSNMVDHLAYNLMENDRTHSALHPFAFDGEVVGMMKILRKTIFQLKDQCEVAGVWQKPRELWWVLSSITLVTMITHAVVNGPIGGAVGYVWKFAASGLVASFLGRIYFKVVMAEEIGGQEQNVRKRFLNLMEVADTTKNSQVFTEAKFIYELIMTSQPAHISLGNYASMNKQLLLGVCSQVVTYFIVLTQYSQQL